MYVHNDRESSLNKRDESHKIIILAVTRDIDDVSFKDDSKQN